MTAASLPAVSLSTLGVPLEELRTCPDIDSEFSFIKKVYFQQSKRHHPDKGGDPAHFRAANEAFLLLREWKESGLLTSFLQESDAADLSHKFHQAKESESGEAANDYYSSQSYEFYEAAEAEPVPIYRVEPARSGRSQCKSVHCHGGQDGRTISKGDLRCASLDEEAGSYRFWNHLTCWRVPMRVWFLLPGGVQHYQHQQRKGTTRSIKRVDGERQGETEDQAIHDPSIDKDLLATYIQALASLNEIILCGFNELTMDQKIEFAIHVWNKNNWARPTKSVASEILQGTAYPATVPTNNTNESAPSTAYSARSIDSLVKTNARNDMVVNLQENNSLSLSRKFLWPIPGRDAPADALKGITVVLTGIFPQVGGGVGLNQGKERLKGYLERFQARVTSAISGKTSILIVGNEPGASKVMKAKKQKNCRLMKVEDVRQAILDGNIQEINPGVGEIKKFSDGYHGNSILNRLTNGERSVLLSKEAYKAPARAKSNDVIDLTIPEKTSRTSAKKKNSASAATESKKRRKKAETKTVKGDSTKMALSNSKKRKKSTMSEKGRNAKKDCTGIQS